MAILNKSSFRKLLLVALSLALGIGVHYVLVKNIEEALQDTLISVAEANNEDLTQFFVNTHNKLLSDDLNLSSSTNSDELRTLSTDKFEEINAIIKNTMAKTDVLKIKIYDMNGVTIYSSNPAQLNSDYSAHDSFIAARQGISTSESNIRDEFQGYSGTVYNRSIISSYIPIRESGDMFDTTPVIGVAEVYLDKTDAVEALNRTVEEFSFILAITLILIAFIISAIVWYLSVSMVEAYINDIEGK